MYTQANTSQNSSRSYLKKKKSDSRLSKFSDIDQKQKTFKKQKTNKRNTSRLSDDYQDIVSYKYEINAVSTNSTNQQRLAKKSSRESSTFHIEPKPILEHINLQLDDVHSPQQILSPHDHYFNNGSTNISIPVSHRFGTRKKVGAPLRTPSGNSRNGGQSQSQQNQSKVSKIHRKSKSTCGFTRNI